MVGVPPCPTSSLGVMERAQLEIRELLEAAKRAATEDRGVGKILAGAPDPERVQMMVVPAARHSRCGWFCSCVAAEGYCTSMVPAVCSGSPFFEGIFGRRGCGVGCNDTMFRVHYHLPSSVTPMGWYVGIILTV